MKRTTLAAAMLTLGSSAVFASDPFQYEVGASYDNSDFSSGMRINGTYYLDPLSNGSGPFAEAAFLNRASSISAEAGRSELDSDLLVSRDVNSWSLSGVYQIEGSDLFVTGNVSRFNGGGQAVFNLGSGYYFSDDFAVIGGVVVDDDAEYLGANIGTKKIWDLGVNGFVNLETSYSANDESPDTMRAAVDYYYTPRMSFGLAHSWPTNFGEFSEGATTLLIEGFVTETIRVSGSYTNVSSGPSDNNSFGLAVSARF